MFLYMPVNTNLRHLYKHPAGWNVLQLSNITHVASVTAAPYRCTIGAKRLVNDCDDGNHAGAYSHIYM